MRSDRQRDAQYQRFYENERENSSWKQCYTRSSNSFISRTILVATSQLAVLSFVLIVSIVVLHPVIRDAKGSRGILWNGSSVLSVAGEKANSVGVIPMNASESNPRGLSLDGLKQCKKHTTRYWIVYFSMLNVMLGLPALGMSRFRLYRRQSNGHGNVEKTQYLRMCELLVILEIPFLTQAFVTFVIALSKTKFLYLCVIHLRLQILMFVVFQNILIVYAYCLNWYQLLLFHRMRENYLFQHTSESPNTARTSSRYMWKGLFKKHSKAVLIFELAKAAKSNNVAGIIAAIQKARQLGGSDFAKKWYKRNLYFFGLLSWSSHNPVHIACAWNAIEVIPHLLDAGFSVNQLDMVQKSNFSISFFYNTIFSFVVFLKTNLAVRSKQNYLGDQAVFANTWLSPLHIAVASGNLHATQLLIKAGANVNLPAISNIPKEATPPIFWLRDTKCAIELIFANANLLVVATGCYLTAVQVAVLGGRHDVAHTLKKWGGDNALTPLHAAAASGDTCMVKGLVEGHVNSLGEVLPGLSRRTPLHWAVIGGQSDTVNILIASGATLDARDILGLTPLAWSCIRNNYSAAKTLLAHGADPNIRDEFGAPMLCKIAEYEPVEANTVKLLVSYGCNLDAKNREGDSGMHIAVRLENRETALALLKSGASLTLVNAKGIRAIDCSSSSNFQYIMKKEAGSRDVMISYTHTHATFATKVRNLLEKNNFTTWFDHTDPTGIGAGAIWREAITRGIMGASLVLCFLTPDYPKSQWCMKELAIAKQFDIPVLALTPEAVKITDELQLYLYTRQIVDFQPAILSILADHKTRSVEYTYDESLFERKISLLLDGVKDIFECRRLNISQNTTHEESPSDDDNAHTIEQIAQVSMGCGAKKSVFIAHGGCHYKFVRLLRASLIAKGYICRSELRRSISFESHNVDLNGHKDEVLGCDVFVVVLSSHSMRSNVLSDQLAFAEDRGKLIVPVLLSKPELDLSKKYSFSRSQMFHFADGIGFEDSFKLLHSHLEQYQSPALDDIKLNIESLDV